MDTASHMRCFYRLTFLLLIHFANASPSILSDTDELVFSGVHDESSETQSVTLTNLDSDRPVNLVFSIEGTDPKAFTIIETDPRSLKQNQSSQISLRFTPPQNLIGCLEAICRIMDTNGENLATVHLYGLSAKGQEGGGEPGMDLILKTLGFKVDVGWSGLKNHTRAELIGEEIAGERFKKAGPGPVNMEPVARYSPDFLLPFGYYWIEDTTIHHETVGTLALKSETRYEQNTLYPSLASGTTSFDPGDQAFGLFTTSPTHTAYTQDSLNAPFGPKHVTHAVRVYPARNRTGQLIENAYLICFEEAKNGDYQDYVFLLQNVIAQRESDK